MATQTGSIDLEATNAAKLYAEAGFTNAAQTYATKSELTVSANQIRGEVSETYATKDEAALELSKSGNAVVLDEAADARLKALTIHGLSQQDGTPSPNAPVPIKSVQSGNCISPTPWRIGANYYSIAVGQTLNPTTDGGVTVTQNGDGSLTLEITTANRGAVFLTSLLPAGEFARNVGLITGADSTTRLSFYRLDADMKILASYNTNGGALANWPSGTSTLAEDGYFALAIGGTTAGKTVTLGRMFVESTSIMTPPFDRYGCVSVASCGKNLFDTTSLNVLGAANGGKAVSASGVISAIDTANDSRATNTINQSDYVCWLDAGTYTLSVSVDTTSNNSYCGFFVRKTVGNSAVVYHSGTSTFAESFTDTFTLSERTQVYFSFKLYTAQIRIQLERGSTATAYEPYSSTTTPIPVTLRSLPDGMHDEWISGETADTLVQRVGETMQAVTDGVTGTVGVDVLSSTGEIANGAQVLYKLATPVTTTLAHVNLPYVHDGDSVWVDAQVTPNIDVAYWSKNGESVSALSSTLTQTAAGLELELQGKVDSSEEWVSWMHAGTDPTTHEPYLAMGQDSDYPSVVYGSGEAQFYDGAGDVEHNILARFGSNGAIIGRSDESHITQTATTTRLFGSDGSLVLEARFQNVSDGHGNTKQGVRVTDSGNVSHIDVSPTTDASGFDGKLDLDVYMKGIGLMSSNGGEVEISSDFAANGLHAIVEARKTISGTEQAHGFTLGFDLNDNPYVNIDNPAVWLAALGLTVQQSDMTFASGLSSSYGSAPVRKYGAMGILKLNSVRLASQLASGSSVVIGTLPTGYVPVGSVDMHINIESNSSNYRNNYIVIEYSGSSNPGRVTLYNRSGAAIPNTVTFSCTCPFFI